MSTQFLEDFKGYGTGAVGIARMLNGVYANVQSSDLVADPDPTAGGGTVYKFGPGSGFDGNGFRRVLSGFRTTIGIAARYWLNKLPDTNRLALWEYGDTNANIHVSIYVDASGFLKAIRHDYFSEVVLGTSAAPVVIANAWRHMEVKAVFSATVGTIEVRVEGVTVMNLAGLNMYSNNPALLPSIINIRCTNYNAQSTGATVYVKDLICWDGLGTVDNDFFGSCIVYRIVPDADVLLNWTPNPADGIGYNKINELTPDDDASYIAAPYPFPAGPYKCSLSDLPATVTSVKAVQVVHRSRKIDGGDGNIQVGLISGGVTGLGADRPITSAYTYWQDNYDVNPNGAVAWTRAAVNALNLQLNRTL